MKLIHPEINNAILFDEEHIQILSIENKNYFSKILEEITFQNHGKAGKFVLSNDNKDYSIEKEVVIIHSPFTIDFNDKKLYKELFKEMESIAIGEDYYIQTQDVLSCVTQLLHELSDETEYDLDIPKEYDLAYLIKYSGIKFLEEYENLQEKVIDYILLLSQVLKTKLFILVNFHSYFSDDVIENLYNTFLMKKINVLLFENNMYDTLLPKERILIIDEDLCEITR